MSNYIEVIAVVEGKTEQVFIESILAPYLGHRNIGISATQVSKPGQKGGDVRFSKVKRDISGHLKQRSDTYVTTLVDYYGTKEWPGLERLTSNHSPADIADLLNTEAKREMSQVLQSSVDVEKRFIPYIAIHEFESLLFSDSFILADELGVNQQLVDAILEQCGEPESINNSEQTAPSKRLESLYSQFKKTTTGIAIAERIGIEPMREACPLFNAWLDEFERLQGAA